MHVTDVWYPRLDHVTLAWLPRPPTAVVVNGGDNDRAVAMAKTMTMTMSMTMTMAVAMEPMTAVTPALVDG